MMYGDRLAAMGPRLQGNRATAPRLGRWALAFVLFIPTWFSRSGWRGAVFACCRPHGCATAAS